MDAQEQASASMRRQTVRMKHLISSMQRLTAVSCATGLAMSRFNGIVREAAYWEGIKARDPEGFRRAQQLSQQTPLSISEAYERERTR